MNRRKSKFHRDIRDIRDIVELSPEARRILDKIAILRFLKRKEQTNKSTEESNKGETQ